MRLAPTTSTSPLGEPGFKYEQQIWGDLIHGTKEQLQRIGLAVGMAFPGEPNGPKKRITTTDHRGFPVRIEDGSYNGDGIYSASISFPGRDEPDYYPCTDYAPGVRKREGPWCDEYVGTAVALHNAGLVRFDQLPGQPGIRKTRVTIFPDGTIPAGASGMFSEAKQPGAKSIERASRNTFMVSIRITLEEGRKRDDDYQSKKCGWEQRMRALPRPAPLIPLPWDGRSTAKAQPEPKYRSDGNVLYLLPRAEGRAAP